MPCQWDRTWTDTTQLMSCDWVQCLKPPTPPKSAHLRVNYWDEQPIEFGDSVEFVCQRGFQFEDDPSREIGFDTIEIDLVLSTLRSGNYR